MVRRDLLCQGARLRRKYQPQIHILGNILRTHILVLIRQDPCQLWLIVSYQYVGRRVNEAKLQV